MWTLTTAMGVLVTWAMGIPSTVVRSAPDGLRITNAEVIAGEPFGFGKITFEPGSGDGLTELTDNFQISDADHRIFYPVISQRFLDRVIDAIDNASSTQSSRLTVWFLVRGRQPLTIRLSGGTTTEAQVDVKEVRPNAQRRMARQWWREYRDAAQHRARTGDIPPLIDAYLVAMLAGRLGNDSRDLFTADDKRDPLRSTLDLIFDSESFQSGLITELMGRSDFDGRVQNLPDSPQWSAPPDLPIDDSIEVEHIAVGVPRECFYLRFGNWQNQLWLKHLLADYGGDLSRLIQLRGHRATNSEDLLAPLALQSSSLDELFGGRAIADLAVIGTDVYSQRHASIGVLFQSKGDLFKNNFSKRRSKFAEEQRANGVKLESLDVDGQPISYLSSSDGTIRSFFVSSGDLHLVTSSITLVERFLQAVQGGHNLASEPSFRLARRLMPLKRDDTVFVFVPESFFHNLLGPTYQIELLRRSYATAISRIEQCARIVRSLRGTRSDRSGRDGACRSAPAWLVQPTADSIGEGASHTPLFAMCQPNVPLADVRIGSVTASEADWYRQRADYFHRRLAVLIRSSWP